MSPEDAEQEAAEPEDAEYWAAIEELTDETLRPYVSLLSGETLETMRCVMVATLGTHPEVEVLTREIVRRRRRPISGGDGAGRKAVVLVK